MIDRYSRPEMRALWEPESKYGMWLEVELLACEAWAQLGRIPKDAVRRLREKATFDVNRINEIELTVKHDVIAFTTAVAETVGEEGKYVHYGLTSYDVVDTALSALMVKAADLILAGLERLGEVLARRAREFKDTVMIGRTHGVHAEPITFGLKLALWYAENQRNIERMQRARQVIAVGRLAGAVGTHANIDPFVEEYVCEKLGLVPAPLSTQVLQRDRHAEYLYALAQIGSSLDKFATEIRGMQRTEVREVEEYFAKGQKGSSAMPHKRNPVACEQLSGLARVLRGHLLAAMENQNLWQERDISNSSVERIIIPDSTILVDYMLHRFTQIMENLLVYPEQMLKNLELTGGLIFSQRVLLALVGKGLSREEAYRLVQGYAMQAWETGANFRRLIEESAAVAALLSPGEIADCFDYQHHLVHVDTHFRRLNLI
ncbi:MAG: adenylosuccinate lyase [Bacillota bacterium]